MSDLLVTFVRFIAEKTSLIFKDSVKLKVVASKEKKPHDDVYAILVSFSVKFTVNISQ